MNNRAIQPEDVPRTLFDFDGVVMAPLFVGLEMTVNQRVGMGGIGLMHMCGLKR